MSLVACSAVVAVFSMLLGSLGMIFWVKPPRNTVFFVGCRDEGNCLDLCGVLEVAWKFVEFRTKANKLLVLA